MSNSSSSKAQSSSSLKSNPSAPNINEYLYKILVVGDLGAGKTSIIKRYVHNTFSLHYKSTIGVDFALKVIPWSNETVVRLQLWDIAGQERFGSMTRVYYKEAVGAVVVFDLTRPLTYEGVLKWKRDIDEKVCLPDGTKIPVILLANKKDIGSISNLPNSIDTFAKENGFIGWFETSAKENINIEEGCKFLVQNILQRESLNRTTVPRTRQISNNPEKNSTIKGKSLAMSGSEEFLKTNSGGGQCC